MGEKKKKLETSNMQTEKNNAKKSGNGIKARKLWTILGTIILLAIIAVSVVVNQVTKRQGGVITSELAKAMTYDQVEDGDEDLDETPNVKFDAFFLRDINNDGYTEGIRGTCKEIGDEDTLYMELNVQTAGYLKDAKITINSDNFYLQTALPEDEEFKSSYIGNNIKTIEFKDIANGTQKTITGIVRSGDYSYTSSRAAAIGSNINNYSKVNSVTLTGTYVNGTQEIPISKTVNFNIDWYGTTTARINTTAQNKNIEDAIDEENGVVNLDFTIYTQEAEQELLLSSNHVEGEIPELNGYAPTAVKYTGSVGIFNYNAETRTFTIDKTAVVDGSGNITTSVARSNSYSIRVTYPIEAYQELGTDTVTLSIPVSTYYEGYNNKSTEFTNPYRSNTASSTIVVSYSKPIGRATSFEVTVGRRIYSPTSRYIVSKEKPLRLYNGTSEAETDDTYLVTWYAGIGSSGATSGLVMKETRDGEDQVADQFIKTNSERESMENVTANVGIYFSGADTILGEEGWIRVYDEDTDNLLVTFTADNWNTYSSNNPYTYEIPVKHIRVETSEVNASTNLYVYNVKELDDDYIVDNYTLGEFEELQYINSTLVGYAGGTYINSDTDQAIYEAPVSIANIRLSNNTISTQVTEEDLDITITTETNTTYNQAMWKNGTFLVKLPEEIIDVQINNVSISNSNVSLESYELIEQNGIRFIKIVTQNDVEATYSITINVDISPDPREATASRQVELYAANENASYYYYDVQDIYDVNNNLNTNETVNHTSTSLSMVSPNSLLTNQTATNFDDKGTEVVSPQIADVKPNYAVVDQEQEEQTATIGVQIRNNYASTISEIQIVGKIPFEGNTYVQSGGDLGSSFTTKMTDAGIELPAELEDIATVYYSTNENPDRDLSNASNGWVTTDQVTNWDNIKTYLIDLGDYVMPTGVEHTFYYIIKIPNGLEYNKIAYSHHGVYFCLDTDQGKYRTQTEPNKLGFRIAEKFDLELSKYQTGQDRLVSGATYSITEITTNDSGEEVKGEARTGVTNSQGKLTITNLYAEKTYEIQEIKSPDDYELNSDVIRFIGHVDDQGNLTIENLQGTTKGDMTVTKEADENYKVQAAVEDEVKAGIKITKKEQGTNNLLKGVHFKLTGYNLSENGRTVTTNNSGEITINGLSIGQEYTLKETKAEGYYLSSPIKFRIVNNSGSYSLEQISDQEATGTIASQSTTEEDGIPTINITLENEKIPTYDLEIIKVKKTTDTTVSDNELIADESADIASTEVEYLEGAKFRLYKGTEEIGAYTTDSTGKVTITGLYQYESDKGIDQTYTLKEVFAPEGYAKVQDITFKAEMVNGALVLTEIDEGGETTSERYTADGTTISLTIEDSPSFKLIKKDAETQELLAGVKFAIYNVDDGTEQLATNSKGEIIGTKEIIDGIEYYVVETDENGEITADLPEGLYKAVEVEADEKYELEGQEYYFGVGASREAPTTMVATQASSIGGSGSDQITSVAATSDGGYIAVGYFRSDRIKINNQEIINNSDIWYGSVYHSDGLIIKYNDDGEVEWATGIGGNGEDEITSVAETNDGFYVVGGYFSGDSITVDGYTLNNNSGSTSYLDGMVIKYDADGKVKWATSVGGYNDDEITSVAVVDDGYIVGGYFNNSITIGAYILTSTSYSDGMVIKYDTDGKVKWATSVGGDNVDEINSVVSTNDGGIMVGGVFNSSNIEIGEYKLENTSMDNGTGDAMLIKYNSTGEVDWAKSFGRDAQDYISTIKKTSRGTYIIAAYSSGMSAHTIILNVENQNVSVYGDGGSVLMEYTENGTLNWVKTISSYWSDTYSIDSVEVTNDGGVIAGGYFDSDSINIRGYTLTSSGNSDGMVIKCDANGNVEWVKSIGGSSTDEITSVAATADGGYIVGGHFSDIITVGNYNLTNNGSSDGMVIKYENIELGNPITLQAQSIGENSDDQIYSVVGTSDGGYVVGGKFQSSSITVGDYTLTNAGSTDSSDGMVIKYNSNGEVEWVTSIGGSSTDEITSVAETSDGGYIVGGKFQSSSITVGGYILTNAGITSFSDGMVIKYNSNGKVEWVTSIGGSSTDEITSVAATADGGYIVGGYFSDIITVGNYNLTNNGRSDGMVIKYDSSGEVEWATNIGGMDSDEITSVAVTVDGYIVGGYFYSDSITIGDYTITSKQATYSGMVIKYDVNGNVKWVTSVGNETGQITSVVGTSDGGYIAGGVFYSDSISVGDYTIKNNSSSEIYADGIVIKYSSSGEVEWAKGIGGSNNDYINSVVGTSDGGYIVGGHLGSSITVGNYNLTNNGSSDGMVIKYNSSGEVEWAKGIGGSSGDYIRSATEANNGEYIAGGYFQSTTIETDGYTLTNVGSYDGMILKIANQNGVPEVQELVVENELKQFEITTDVEEINGVKGGSISGEDASPYETVKYGGSSTQSIVMAPESGYEIIKITVNGEELLDYEVDSNGSYTLPQFTNMTEDKHIVVTYAQTTNKFVINKVDSTTDEALSGAIFTIDEIDDSVEETELYHAEVTTNVEGQGITQIPFGTYKITEIQAPEGYEALAGPITIEFSEAGINVTENQNSVSVTVNDAGELVIENVARGKVIVHHYLRGEEGNYTTTKVAEDDLLEGTIGTNYEATPHLDLEQYELIKDVDGNYIVPDGNNTYYESAAATGTYAAATQEVTYYYELKEIPLVVHHYIEGTEISVPLANGSSAESEEYFGKENTGYTTNAISEEELNSRYELVETPSNATGTYSPTDVEVIYYYRLVERDLTITKNGEDGELLEGVTFRITNIETNEYEDYTTNAQGQITVTLEAGDYEVEEIATIDGYELPENAVHEVSITNAQDSYTLSIDNEKKTGQVTIHHYIYDEAQGGETTTKVPSNVEGQVVEDVVQTGNVGDIWASKEAENVSPAYEFVKAEGATSGTYTEAIQEVIYYYQLKDGKITENTIAKIGTEKITKEDQEVSYTITYNATVDEHIGDAVVTIVDKLPYEIDEQKSSISGGVYNAADKTITWTERVENIDTFTAGEAREISISKNITVVYVNMDYSKTSFDNIAQGTIKLEATNQEESTPEATVTTETEFTKDVTVTKEWNHTNNIYEIPTSVTIQLKNGGTVEETVTLTESNATQDNVNVWTYTFEKLPKYDGNGNEINYTVDEVNDGSLEYYRKEINGTTIKNTYNGPVIEAEKEMTTENGLSYVVEGETITYTIKVQNSGEVGKDVLVKDRIPEGTSFVTGSIKVNGASNYELNSELVDLTTKTATDLANGIEVNVPARTNETTPREVAVSFEVTVNELEGETLTRKITNTATVDKDPDNPNTEVETTDEVTTTVNKPKLEYSKESNPTSGSTVKAGDEITYTIHLDNSDGTAPISVVVKDNIPEGTSFVTGSIRVGGQAQEGMTEDNLTSGINVDIAAGESKDFEFKARVNDINNGDKITNVATIDQKPNNPDNPEDRTNETEHTYVEAVIEAEKEMTTENSLSYVVEGEKITYTIRVRNNGDLATNVLVKDNIPEGTSFVTGSIKVNGVIDSSKIDTDLANGIEVNVPARANETTPGEVAVSFEVTVDELEENISEKEITNIATVDKNPDNPNTEVEATNEVKVPVLTYKKTVEIIRNENIDKGENNNISENAVTAGDRIRYTIEVNNVGEEAITNLVVKDTVPAGTTIYQINDDGEISLNDTNEITWTIEEVAGGTTKEVSFEVTVNYDKEAKTITNVGVVDGKETNEVETPYEVPELDLESSIVKEGTGRITSTEETVSYTISYKAEIGEFAGKGKLKIVDYLPYEIDLSNSEIEGLEEGRAIYNAEEKTITWEEDLGNINTYANAEGIVTVERTKALTLKYIYPDEENLSGTIENKVEGTITLTQEKETENPENPDEPIIEEVTVKEEKVEDNHEIEVAIPAKVIVHHYIYDEEKGGETTEQVPSKDGGKVADETIEGIVGDRYDTNPSGNINENYECVNAEPDKHEGNMTKTDIEVIYYYKLKTIQWESAINKTATATKQEEREYETGEVDQDGNLITETKTVEVLTREDGVVTYKISYRVGINNYKGKATITIVDKLPASLNISDARVDLDVDETAGEKVIYDEETKTITWTREVDVDTFATGTMYNQTFEKEIKVVYKDQDVTTILVNEVTGTVIIYYPEGHSSNPGGERGSNTATDTSEVEQDYKVAKEVEKVWDDNDDLKGRRPDSVTMQLTANGSTSYNGQELEKVVLTEDKLTHTFTNLPKYDEFGKEITYSVVETETNVGDLEYYDPAAITSGTIEIGQDADPAITANEKIIVTNKYKLMNTDLESNIEKTGTEKITESKEEVKYNISYNASITEYIGEALVTVVDTLPYKLATDEEGDLVEGIDLAGGEYDDVTKTITWKVKIDHINTYTNRDYVVDFDEEVTLIYGDLDANKRSMTNHVKGTIDLYETEKTNTVKTTYDTIIEVPGKVIVKYVDRETGEEITYIEEQEDGTTIEKTYGYEIDGLVGDEYTTEQKEIPAYTYKENTGNTSGNLIEGTIEVIYYYERTIAGGVHVTYVDEEGNKIEEDETYEGRVREPYTTEQKDIYGYEFVRVEGEPEGEMTEDIIEVVYVYKKVPAKVIVRYLEKDDTSDDDSDNKVLYPEMVIEGYVKDEYTTIRQVIENYRAAEPEPENKEGAMTPEDIYVTYYYEKIPSGIVTSIYVDIDTGEEILYKDENTGEHKTYKEEVQGYVGEKYETEEKDIPYYKIVEELIPINKEGIYTEEDVEVTYYYKKLSFNVGVDKNIEKIMINGKEQKVLDGKLNKVEVVGSKVSSTEVEITYSINISNTGELEGTATVLEDIPNNFEVKSQGTSSEWQETEDGALEAEVSLKAGETKKLEVVLSWINGQNNFGTQKNTAEIIETENPARYTETTEEDNKSEAEIIISIKTGETERVVIFIVIATAMLITLTVFLYVTSRYAKEYEQKKKIM